MEWAYNCKLMIITLLYYYAVVCLSSTVYIRYKNYSRINKCTIELLYFVEWMSGGQC